MGCVCVCVAAVLCSSVFLGVFSLFHADLYEPFALSRTCVCFSLSLSLSHSHVCPPTGQCPNGLSCFPSISLCKYSGSASDPTRTRLLSAHACLEGKKNTRTRAVFLSPSLYLTVGKCFSVRNLEIIHRTSQTMEKPWYMFSMNIPCISRHKKSPNFTSLVGFVFQKVCA